MEKFDPFKSQSAETSVAQGSGLGEKLESAAIPFHYERHDRGEIAQFLESALHVINSLGLTTTWRPTADDIKNYGTPLCIDGMDGVRASFSTTNGFKVSFTNGFEKWDNPERRRIATALRDAGIPVVGPFIEDPETGK